MAKVICVLYPKIHGWCPYEYRNPGLHGLIDVYSLGLTGREGGEGTEAEIGNWEKRNRYC